MTKAEAIQYLQQLYPNGGHCWLDEQRIEAIGMAVKALQEEPVELKDVDLENYNKVQKIREEVERMQLYTQSEVLKQVLDYIDKVQEEPVSIWHDASEETPTSGLNILMVRKEEEDTNYPPIAGCFHGTNSRLDGRNWGYYNGFCYNEIEPPVKWAYIDDILNLSNVERTVKNWKEPVSEDLGEYINELSKRFPEVSFAKLSRIAVRVAKWQHEQVEKEYSNLNKGLVSAKGIAVYMAYEKGKEDMKQQMMKDAVDGWVFRDIKEGKLRISDNKECWNGIRIPEKSIEKSYLFCTTDDAIKVKLVIVKEE